MSQPQRIALVSSQVVTPDGIGPAGILVEEGQIQAVVSPDAVPSDWPTRNVGESMILPGLVDTHVHINEPGRTKWEGFETATQAACAGGITTLVDMPLNCIPVTTSLSALQEKLSATSGKLRVDCGFYGGVVPGNTDQLEPMIQAGVKGFKAFLCPSGIDDFPPATEADLRQAMPILARHRIPLLVHAELETPTSQALPEPNPHQYATYLASRPGTWETDAIAMMIRLAKEFNCPVHIVHLACADALPMLAQARSEGVPITVETCPHYLVFAAEEIPDGDTRYKCAPPIREADNRHRLWQGLQDGVIDFIISDHSPCVPELKKLETGDFMGAWGGISSLQFGLSSIWTEARQRGFGISQVVGWMSTRPAQMVGLTGQKGAIAPGYDADLVLWDPLAPVTIQPETTYHRNKLTPYAGRQLVGRVLETWLAGAPIYVAQHPNEGPPRGRQLLTSRQPVGASTQQGTEESHP
jgi:allantoinase